MAFARLVGELGSTHPEWSFLVTGDSRGADPLPARVQLTGVLDTPFDLLAESRAIAIL